MWKTFFYIGFFFLPYQFNHPQCIKENSYNPDLCLFVKANRLTAGYINLLPREKFIREVARNSGLIVIDPGHGGDDFGAVGVSGVKEKDVALSIGKILRDLLKKQGFKVKMTRKKDIYLSLEERSKKVITFQPEIFISIHSNWAENREARGAEIYFAGFYASDKQALRVVETENIGKKVNKDVLKIVADLILWRQTEQSSNLAESINYYFSAFQGKLNRGKKRGPFWLLLSTGVPSVLIEAGFLSNPEEEKLLVNPRYQKKISRIIFSGIVNYLANNIKDKKPQ